MRRIPLLLAGTLLLLAGEVRAGGPAGPVVVELFTSQGCDSCPPADALLGELARQPDVLALALHVTYWNDLGWKDPFSQDQFDARQRRYVQALHLSAAYTPQMVLNGAQDVVGSQRVAVNRALARATSPAAIALRRDGEVLNVALPALPRACHCELTLFGVRSQATTSIGRGENGGKTLQEFQLVRVMRSLGPWSGDARVVQVALTAVPAEVDAYAVLAQERVSGRVVAAGR